MKNPIPFNRPFVTGNEVEYIIQAHANSKLAGDGPFTKKCHKWLEENTGAEKALLTHSCTAALEMFALLLDIKSGDEIIMPSYTFVSTANAFALRGGIPVFVDIREDTLNLDETLIEAAITEKTKAIVVVHYAGVACKMDAILDIGKRHNIPILEDAAQGVMAKYQGQALGSIGDLGALSFHETKNVISGEGGALLINTNKYSQRAEIIREKGTDRSRFFRGEVDKYTWQDLGSSFLPGEIVAAFLWAQFEQSQNITAQRLSAWNFYNEALARFEDMNLLRRPVIPGDCEHNGHMYYIILPSSHERTQVLNQLAERGINSVFHYVPLHNSPAGRRYCRSHGTLEKTENFSERLVRLPLWVNITRDSQAHIIHALSEVLVS